MQKKIIFYGTSPSIVYAIEAIRANDTESTITLFSPEGFLPYTRDLFDQFISEKVDENQLMVRSADFFKEKNVDVVTDNQVTKINVNHKKIYTEQKNQYNFDVLVLSDPHQFKLKNIKGHNKTGVYALDTLNSANVLRNDLHLYDNVLIASDSITGFRMAQAIVEKGKEANLIVSTELSSILNIAPEELASQLESLVEKGLNVYENTSVEEVLGEGDARAVRLKGGKVIAAQVIFIESKMLDFKILADTGIDNNNGLVVNQTFQTNYDFIYAIDRAVSKEENASFGSGEEELRRQGQVIGQEILRNEANQAQEVPSSTVN